MKTVIFPHSLFTLLLQFYPLKWKEKNNVLNYYLCPFTKIEIQQSDVIFTTKCKTNYKKKMYNVFTFSVHKQITSF